MKDDVTGVILVGGKSSRVGRDKAFLPVDGVPIFEKVLEVLKRHLEKVILIGDRPERFLKYGLPVYPDLYAGSSLGGLYTGLHASVTPYIFAAPCDLPFASAELLKYMASLREGYDVVVPVTAGFSEPLFALYSKDCLNPMRELLEAGNFRIFDFYPRVRVRRVLETELAPLDGSGTAFLNVNTLEEYERLLREGENDR
jgi:molybdopterin-guanine dinucleotide biosynthesis protein A